MQHNQGIISPERWTAIIPAAGPRVPARLRSAKNPVSRSLEGLFLTGSWIFCCPSRLASFWRFLQRGAVLSSLRLKKHGRTAWQQGRFQIAIQPVPAGMGDAVSIGLENVTTENIRDRMG